MQINDIQLSRKHLKQLTGTELNATTVIIREQILNFLSKTE